MCCLRSTILALAIGLGLAARADVIDVTSTTLVAGRTQVRPAGDQAVVPAYEFVTVRANRLKSEWVGDLGVYVQGYGTLDLAGTRERLGPGADLNLAYVEGTLLEKKLRFRAGRQFVTGGAARIGQLDGLSATYQLPMSLVVQAWGGAPVAPLFGTARGDVMGGARASWRPTFQSEIGASFQQILLSGRTSRQELGVDGRAILMQTVVLTGALFVVPLESRLSEARVEAAWDARSDLTIAARWQRTAPDLFLSLRSTLSVFATEETRDGAGVWASYIPARHWSIFGEYTRLGGTANEGKVDDTGNLLAGRLAFTPGRNTFGAEVRAMSYGLDGHITPRFFAVFRPIPKFSVSCDLAASALDRTVNGQSTSVTATAAGGWEFSPGWRAVGAVIAGSTPVFERRFEAMAKLEWNQVIRVREETP